MICGYRQGFLKWMLRKNDNQIRGTVVPTKKGTNLPGFP